MTIVTVALGVYEIVNSFSFDKYDDRKISNDIKSITTFIESEDNKKDKINMFFYYNHLFY